MKRTSRPAKRTSRRPKRGSRRPVHNPKLVGNDGQPNDPIFLEAIDSIEALLSRPGEYWTTTGQSAYVVAKSLAWHPLVLPGEETYFAEGSVYHFSVLDEPRNTITDVLPTAFVLQEQQLEEQYQDYGPAERNGRLTRNGDSLDWGVTENYFIETIAAYDKWESAFWRELLQNSRDAGATRIDLSAEEVTFTDPETKQSVPAIMCVCRDNGSGMDQSTLVRAFFTRGGTVKPAGAVGGFGDAKELILVPWLGYEVRTRDLLARGHHQRLLEPIQSGQPSIQGTEVKVWMPVAMSTTGTFAESVLEKSNLGGISVYVDGKRVNAQLIGGTKTRESAVTVTTYTVRYVDRGEARERKFSYKDESQDFYWDLRKRNITPEVSENTREVGRMEIWHQPRSKRSGCYVRGSGVFMFQKDIDSAIKGALFVDVFAPPRGVFTRKRDDLASSSNAKSFVEAYLAELAVDPLSALKKERADRNKLMTIYGGSGAVDVRAGIARNVVEQMERRRASAAQTAAEMASLRTVADLKPKKSGAVEMTAEAAADALKVLMVALQRQEQESEREGGPDLTPLPAAFEATAKSVEFVNREQLAGALQFAAWKPDLFVYQNLDNWEMTKDFNPLTMRPKYLRLLRLWTELCKYALIKLGMFKPFGVGWAFDTEKDESGNEMVIGALYTRKHSCDWLLINPVEMKRKPGSSDDYPSYEIVGDHYDLSNERDIRNLCASVIHEVTHMQGFMKHDQNYAYALTKNIEIAFGMEQAAKKILKAVNAQTREEGAARKAPQVEKVSVPWDVMVGRVTYAMQAWDGLSWSGLRAVESGDNTPEQIAKDVERYYVSPESALEDMRRHPPKKAEFVLKPKTVIKLHDALAEKNVFRDLTDEQAREATQLAWQNVPADPREKIAPPSEVGVYSWIKIGKVKGSPNLYEYVLRTGYVGQRGEEVGRIQIEDYGVYSALEDNSPGAIGAFEKKNNIHRRWQDNLVFISESSGTDWRLSPSGWPMVRDTSGTYGGGSGGALDVKVEKEKDGSGYAYTYGGGPPSKTWPSVAEAQKYVVEWAIAHRGTSGD